MWALIGTFTRTLRNIENFMRLYFIKDIYRNLPFLVSMKVLTLVNVRGN